MVLSLRQRPLACAAYANHHLLTLLAPLPIHSHVLMHSQHVYEDEVKLVMASTAGVQRLLAVSDDGDDVTVFKRIVVRRWSAAMECAMVYKTAENTGRY